jgi:hypothetical protein
MQEVVRRLVHESALSRVRHRALLDTLMEGPFESRRYFAHFRSLMARDLSALAGKLFMESEDFAKYFGDWAKADEAKYRNVWSPEVEPSVPKRTRKKTP